MNNGPLRQGPHGQFATGTRTHPPTPRNEGGGSCGYRGICHRHTPDQFKPPSLPCKSRYDYAQAVSVAPGNAFAPVFGPGLRNGKIFVR